MLYYLSVLLVLSTVTAINFQLYPGVERCFVVAGGEQYHIEYVVSGSEENSTSFRIVHGESNITEY
jgi:hypothetical protein